MQLIRKNKKTNLVLIFFFVSGFFVFVNGAKAYDPPIGIPAPAFGIDEPTYQSSLHCPNWPDAENSITNGQQYDCYYTDNSTTCTDSENVYGYPNNPRCTIANSKTLTAGTYMDIRGGRDVPYTSPRFNWSGIGTSEDYILISGAKAIEKPKLASLLHIGYRNENAKYFIIENFEHVVAKAEVRPIFDFLELEYISFRNLFFDGQRVQGSNLAASYNGKTNGQLNNIVFYDNEMSRSGNVNALDQDDSPSFGVQCGVSHVWILDNVGYESGGDGVILAHGCNFSTHHVYIGRNEFWGHRENGIDLKQANDVVVSENVIYNHRPTNSSSGEGIVIHYDPSRIWILNNIIYDCEYGIVSTGMWDSAIIGNLIYNIHNSGETYEPHSGYSRGAAIHSRNTARLTIANNTLYDYDTGVQAPSLGGITSLVNNIFSERTEAESYDVYFGNTIQTTAVDIDNNLFFKSAGMARFGWGSTAGISLEQLKNNYSGKCIDCIESSPLYLNAASKNFQLQASSPAIDGGALADIYATFQALYGVDIRKDINNTTRPQNSSWDIGAYEHVVQVRADVDGSSEITTTDALLTLRNSLGLSMNGTAWQASATTGDVNCDGASNSTDALLILRYSLGLNMSETGWCE